MDMMLNSLPSRTWNRLGLNESFVTIDGDFENYTPEVIGEGQNAVWTPDAGQEFAWDDIETGMGEDIRTLAAHAPLGLVETAPGAEMTAPITLHYHYRDGQRGLSRLRLHAGENSTLSVVLLLDSDSARGLSAIQTEVRAEKGSSVKLYVAQLAGKDFVCLNDVGGVCEDSASFELVKLELGAGELYAGTHVDLKGRESAFNADVGYYVRSGKKLDMNYVALHHGARTNSLMEVSGTLEDGAKKVFRGTIDFPRGCPGAKGTESENVLLLGDEVINQSVPLILCKEEDVEGNHGASIGRLDDKVLFYLGTRGIPEEAAQQIIAHSRIEAVCNKVPDESVREAVHNFEL